MLYPARPLPPESVDAVQVRLAPLDVTLAAVGVPGWVGGVVSAEPPPSASRTVLYAAFSTKFSSARWAEPSPGKTPGIHEYLSVKPHSVIPTHRVTARQA